MRLVPSHVTNAISTRMVALTIQVNIEAYRAPQCLPSLRCVTISANWQLTFCREDDMYQKDNVER